MAKVSDVLALSDSRRVFHLKVPIWVFDLMRVKATFVQLLAIFDHNLCSIFVAKSKLTITQNSVSK